MNMRRTKILLLATALMLAMGPIATWLGSSAAAQIGSHLVGTVYDADGKPYPNATLVFTNRDTRKVFTITTDAKGRYNTPEIANANWDIDVKDPSGAVIYQTGIQISANGSQEFTHDIHIVISEEQKKQQAEQKRFQGMKGHFDAGVAAYNQGVVLQKQLAQAPADQKDALQAQVNQFGDTSVTEFQAALATMSETDSNRHIVLYRLAQSYEMEGKLDQAIAFYQQSIAAFPKPSGPDRDLAGSYNNLGNDYAKLGKIDEAMDAYQKAADADPPDAASAWRNAGASLYNAGKMQEAVVPFQKAAALDPKNAQTWFLLGTCLMNTMGSRQEGDKLIPVITPGTVEAFQKAVELDPDGQWGQQAKQDLDALQAMGAGIDTKYRTKGKT
jgi:tetratricopeptide (TPR) repeat protein